MAEPSDRLGPLGALHRQVVCSDLLTVAQHPKGKLVTGRAALGYVLLYICPEHAREFRVAPYVFAFRIRGYSNANWSRID